MRKISIKAHLDPASASAGIRSAERRQLYLETSGGLPGGAVANVAIHNISAGGMLIETDLDLVPGLEIQVDLPHEPSVPAEIVWSSGRYFGCRFNRPIGSAALSAVQLKAEAPLPSELRQSIPTHGHGLAFGKMLEQQRKARGLTLEQVASRLGVSKPTVWAWEKGKARPLEDRYPAIAEALGLSVSDLREGDQPDSVAGLLKTSREQIARALGIEPGSVRILIEL